MTNDRKKLKRKLRRGQKAILRVLPPGLIDGLPNEDQRAISAVVGKPTVFEGYERDGTVKLEFMDKDATIHLIWVEPKFVRPWRATSVRKHLWEPPREGFGDQNKRSGLRDGQKKRRRRKLHRGQRVVLEPLPAEMIGSLPKEEQQVLMGVIGRPIVFFNKYEGDGRIELEFVDDDNTTHLVYIDSAFVNVW